MKGWGRDKDAIGKEWGSAEEGLREGWRRDGRGFKWEAMRKERRRGGDQMGNGLGLKGWGRDEEGMENEKGKDGEIIGKGWFRDEEGMGKG